MENNKEAKFEQKEPILLTPEQMPPEKIKSDFNNGNIIYKVNKIPNVQEKKIKIEDFPKDKSFALEDLNFCYSIEENSIINLKVEQIRKNIVDSYLNHYIKDKIQN